jgi:Trk K+ transport system NAD-binding subunit
VNPDAVRSCFLQLPFLSRQPSVVAPSINEDCSVTGKILREKTLMYRTVVSVAEREVIDPTAKTTLKPKFRISANMK